MKRYPTSKGKRNPSKTVGAERGIRGQTEPKPQSQTTSQSDHTDHSLVYLNETKPCCLGPPKTDGSWWRRLTECGPLEKGMANHFSILALRASLTCLFFSYRIFIWIIFYLSHYIPGILHHCRANQKLKCQSRFDARYWMLGAGALGRPRGMEWGGKREEGSGWGTHVYLWWIHFDIWKK